MATLSTFDDFVVGDEIFVTRAIARLLATIDTVELGILDDPASVVTIGTVATDLGQILDVGTVQDDDTYTAQYVAVLSGGAAGYTRTHFTPGITTRLYVRCTCSDGTGPFTAALIDFTPKRGGPYG